MTTSATQSISAKPNDAAFTRRELAVFEGYAQNVAHNAVLSAYEKVRGNVTRAFIARKLGVSPSQVTRWLSSPGNYEVKTLGYLLGAMGYVPEIGAVGITDVTHGNNFMHEVADYPASAIKVTTKASTTAHETPEMALAV
jgi:hypothetical protein